MNNLIDKIFKEFDEKFPKEEPIDFTSYGIKAMPQGKDNWLVVPRDKIQSFFHSQISKLIETVKKCVPEEDKRFGFDIYMTGKGAKRKNREYDLEQKGFKEGVDFSRSQTLKNLGELLK